MVIAGAGIIGLSSALELASCGLSVTVLEQGAAMREASWAAAGMLAADDPENPPQLGALAAFSRALYPEFLRRIEQLSGLRVPLRTSETLQGLGRGAPERDALEMLDRDALKARLPDLRNGGRRFLRLDEHSLDPRDLCRALPLAARAAGVRLCEHTRMDVIEPAGGRLRVASSEGEFLARHTLECTGAWAAGRLDREDPLPVAPRKGQILSVTLPAGGPALDCVVRTPELYLVPRGDGRVVVGATVEEAGFDRTVTAAATEALLADAAALWPPILAGELTEQWSGLRPSTPDGLPIVSPLAGPGGGDDRGHRWVATGHFRNGILLAPATAHLVRQRMLGERPAIDLEPFRAARFARALS